MSVCGKCGGSTIDGEKICSACRESFSDVDTTTTESSTKSTKLNITWVFKSFGILLGLLLILGFIIILINLMFGLDDGTTSIWYAIASPIIIYFGSMLAAYKSPEERLREPVIALIVLSIISFPMGNPIGSIISVFMGYWGAKKGLKMPKARLKTVCPRRKFGGAEKKSLLTTTMRSKTFVKKMVGVIPVAIVFIIGATIISIVGGNRKAEMEAQELYEKVKANDPLDVKLLIYRDIVRSYPKTKVAANIMEQDMIWKVYDHLNESELQEKLQNATDRETRNVALQEFEERKLEIKYQKLGEDFYETKILNNGSSTYDFTKVGACTENDADISVYWTSGLFKKQNWIRLKFDVSNGLHIVEKNTSLKLSE